MDPIDEPTKISRRKKRKSRENCKKRKSSERTERKKEIKRACERYILASLKNAY